MNSLGKNFKRDQSAEVEVKPKVKITRSEIKQKEISVESNYKQSRYREISLESKIKADAEAKRLANIEEREAHDLAQIESDNVRFLDSQ
jgi:hypothetical protein